MFYSKLILTKKSKFGDIWLAAHSGILKKLSKAQISAIDLLEAAGKSISLCTVFGFMYNCHFMSMQMILRTQLCLWHSGCLDIFSLVWSGFFTSK